MSVSGSGRAPLPFNYNADGSISLNNIENDQSAEALGNTIDQLGRAGTEAAFRSLRQIQFQIDQQKKTFRASHRTLSQNELRNGENRLSGLMSKAQAARAQLLSTLRGSLSSDQQSTHLEGWSSRQISEGYIPQSGPPLRPSSAPPAPPTIPPTAPPQPQPAPTVPPAPAEPEPPAMLAAGGGQPITRESVLNAIDPSRAANPNPTNPSPHPPSPMYFRMPEDSVIFSSTAARIPSSEETEDKSVVTGLIREVVLEEYTRAFPDRVHGEQLYTTLINRLTAKYEDQLIHFLFSDFESSSPSYGRDQYNNVLRDLKRDIQQIIDQEQQRLRSAIVASGTLTSSASSSPISSSSSPPSPPPSSMATTATSTPAASPTAPPATPSASASSSTTSIPTRRERIIQTLDMARNMDELEIAVRQLNADKLIHPEDGQEYLDEVRTAISRAGIGAFNEQKLSKISFLLHPVRR